MNEQDKFVLFNEIKRKGGGRHQNTIFFKKGGLV